MDWKKLGKALLFPHMAILLVLLPAAAALLIWGMAVMGTESPWAIASYVLAAYTLTVWCFRVPALIRLVKRIKRENKYAVRLTEDTHLRMNLSLLGSLVWNTAYAALQLWLGVVHRSFWFCSLALYYVSLAVMRFLLVRHTRAHTAGEDLRAELKKYRACGWVFLVMNLALSLMVFFMVYWNRTFEHHEITTITMAAYTFTSFTMAIVNVVRYRRYNSPVYSASKAISFAAACVSMLTLSTTMLNTFNDGSMELSEIRLMLGLVGAGVVAVVITMAVVMIARGNKQLRKLGAEDSNPLPSKIP